MVHVAGTWLYSHKMFATTLTLALTLLRCWQVLGCEGPRTFGGLRQALWASNPSYDRFTRPAEARVAAGLQPGDEYQWVPPDEVKVEFRVYSLRHVDTKRGSFTIDANMHVTWNDHRLRYNDTAHGGCLQDSVELNSDFIKEIWTPDPYVANLVEQSRFVHEELRLLSDGALQ